MHQQLRRHLAVGRDILLGRFCTRLQSSIKHETRQRSRRSLGPQACANAPPMHQGSRVLSVYACVGRPGTLGFLFLQGSSKEPPASPFSCPQPTVTRLQGRGGGGGAARAIALESLDISLRRRVHAVVLCVHWP